MFALGGCRSADKSSFNVVFHAALRRVTPPIASLLLYSSARFCSFFCRGRVNRDTSHYVGRVGIRGRRCLGRHRRPLRKIEFVCELREPNCADGISSSPSMLFLSVDKADTARQKKMRNRERERGREKGEGNISYSRGSDSYL